MILPLPFLAPVLLAGLLRVAPPVWAGDTISIFAGWVLDGRGAIERNATVFVVDGRIARIERGRIGTPTHAFPGGTLLPGLIDVHAHPASYERDGKLRGLGDGDSARLAAPIVAANLARTLRAGFTTIQSIGSMADVALRAARARGDLVGPRLITSLNAITDASLSPDSLRALVRRRRDAGAEAIKLFASRGLGDGGAPTMTAEQLGAICGEARTLGLRSIVHAHSSESIRRAVLAGCDQVEHGVFATLDVLTLMAERGTWFDPQCAGVFQNYLDHRLAWFAGGSYATPEGEELLQRGLTLSAALTRLAVATPRLNVAYGTDAVAVANGANGGDLVCRVEQAGMSPLAAITSATSRNAASLGLAHEIGVIATGFVGDLLVVDGNASADIRALARVLLVVQRGRVVHRSTAGAG